MSTSLPVPQASISAYLIEINKFPLLSAEEELQVAKRYRETGDIDAAHQLVTANLRFVVKVAYEYASYGVRMADLIQEGNIGLMTAIKKFDPTKGYRLITYAVWWIRAMIQNHILNTWSLVKIGTTQAQRKLFYKLRQTKRVLERLLPGEETENSLKTNHSVAKILNVRDSDVNDMTVRLQSRDASLDQPIQDDSQTTHLDLMVSSDNQEDLLSKNQEQSALQSQVKKAMTTLNEKERYIVENRLMADEPLTLQEIGDRYHISRERARQLEERAKTKLKQAVLAFA